MHLTSESIYRLALTMVWLAGVSLESKAVEWDQLESWASAMEPSEQPEAWAAAKGELERLAPWAVVKDRDPEGMAPATFPR
ncbi:hypothetical protein Sjap_007587 [Stephania japonica]|uniref:Uncharacterized protein n=1 Tax=Stephania japonica TaxID=461633 RepID=A0AAP0JMY2_9MAGN